MENTRCNAFHEQEDGNRQKRMKCNLTSVVCTRVVVVEWKHYQISKEGIIKGRLTKGEQHLWHKVFS